VTRPQRVAAAILALASVVASVVSTTAARAQGATAQAQFDYGLGEMEAGRFASGCPALAESYRLDPRPGVLFTLAECENKWGKLASALTHYQAYLDLYARMRDDEKVHQRGRDRVAATQRDRLRSDVPELAVALPAAAPPGTTVTRDGVQLGAPLLAVSVPVDPGDHLVVARTPDGVAHEARVTLGRREHRSLVVDLTPPPPAPPPPVAPTLPPWPPPSGPGRTVAWTAGAVGLAGLVVGGVAGGVVLSDKSTITSHCHGLVCDPEGLRAASQARTFGVVSDVGVAVGAAGLALSALFFALSPSRAVQPAVGVASHGAFVGLRATW
jgi:hypothetical protein